MKLSWSLLILLIVSLGLLHARFAIAQSTVAITTNEALVTYPQTVEFRLEVDPETPIVSAVLHYEVDQFNCVDVDTRVPVVVEENRAEWTWVMVRSGNPPPGTQLTWTWTLTDAAGTTITTPEQTVTLMDNRFDWQTIEAEGIRLHWYEGESVGPILLEAAETGLDRLENEMGIQLTDEVEFFIYGSADDMRQAVLYIQNWAGGVAFSEYNTILIGVPPRLAESWGRTTIQHELAHLVVGQFGRSCLGGSRPTWLEEGLAMVAEGEPDEQLLADLEAGIENNRFEPLRSLNGAFPAHDTEAGIAYSQSYSVVQFMLEQYGQEKMQQLLLTLAEGVGYDAALEAVYGVNVDGLELAWREAIGAPPREIPPTPTPVRAASVPTAVPLGLDSEAPAAATVGAPLDGATAAEEASASTSEAAAPTAEAAAPTSEAPAPTAVPPAEETQERPLPALCNLGLLPLLGVVAVLGRLRRPGSA